MLWELGLSEVKIYIVALWITTQCFSEMVTIQTWKQQTFTIYFQTPTSQHADIIRKATM
jgi:radical SAM superfamily enzyme